jgi:hypothetical protein
MGDPPYLIVLELVAGRAQGRHRRDRRITEGLLEPFAHRLDFVFRYIAK